MAKKLKDTTTADISYRMERIAHPWNAQLRERHIEVWCLVRVVKTQRGCSVEPLAVFHSNAGAETFQKDLFEMGFSGKPIEVHPGMRQILKTMKELFG